MLSAQQTSDFWRQAAAIPSAGLDRTVLVIDGAPDSAWILRTLLARLVKHVHVASDARGGLDLARRLRPDLVVCEVDLRGASGFDVCGELRTDPQLAGVPFLFCSHRCTALDELAAVRLGARDFIRKPVLPAHLLARVESILRLKDEQLAIPPTQLQGSLDVVELREVLRALGTHGACGVLTLEGGELCGTLTLRDGRVLRARAGHLVGRDAAIHLLWIDRGAFSFAGAPGRPGGGTAGLGVEELLLEAAWVADELASLGPHVPGPDDKVHVLDLEAARAALADHPELAASLTDDDRIGVATAARRAGTGRLAAGVLLGRLVQRGLAIRTGRTLPPP